MDNGVADTPGKSPTRIGWGLLALALALPALLGAVGVLSAYQVGQLMAEAGFAWLVAAVVLDFLTKKRGATAKANGRIAAATLALVMVAVSGFNVFRDTQKVESAKNELIEQFMATSVEARTAPAIEAGTAPLASAVPVVDEPPALALPPVQPVAGSSEADRAVRFLNAMKTRAKQFAEESAAVDRKFDAVDLSTVLSAESLISKPSLEASRKKLSSYKAAIAARDAMLTKHMALSEQIIRTSDLTEREVAQAMAGLNSSKDAVMRNYADLTAAQLATVKATEDILDFAQQGLGRITTENGQPMFQTQPELDEYQRLIQVLTEVAGTETVITQKVQAQAQTSKQSLVDQLK